MLVRVSDRQEAKASEQSGSHLRLATLVQLLPVAIRFHFVNSGRDRVLRLLQVREMLTADFLFSY